MRKIIVSLILMFSIQSAYSQCSDAGVCFLGDRHKKDMAAESYKNSISLYYSFGTSGSPENYTYNTLKFIGKINLVKNTSLLFDVPYLFQNTGYSSNGIGDVILTVKYDYNFSKGQGLSFQGGIKTATSKFNEKNFRYLNGYGTNDILVGANYNYTYLNFGIAAQLPLQVYEDDTYIFKRGPDLMLRAGYVRKINNINLKLELLGIKRLAKSELENKINITSPSNIIIDNSDFFQLNAVGGVLIDLSDNIAADFGIAFPMLKREENSDGTKRSFTVQSGIIYSF